MWRPRMRRVGALAAALALLSATPAGATGAAWHVEVSGSGQPGVFLRSVSCAAARFCVAVGWTDGGTPDAVAQVFDGDAWRASPVPSGSGVQLLSVSCPPGGATCLATGYDMRSATSIPGVSYRYAKGRWQRLVTPSPARGGVTPLEAVSCASASACEAVGAYYADPRSPDAGVYAYADAYDGRTWTAQRLPHRYDDALLSVSCPAPGSCVAVGNRGSTPDRVLVERLSRGAWAVVAGTTTAPGPGLDSVSCVSPARCVAVGEAGTDPASAVTEVLSGGTWTLRRLRAPSAVAVDLNSVSCWTDGCETVGRLGGGGLGESSGDGVSWSAPQAMPFGGPGAGSDLQAVSCLPDGRCVAAGVRPNSVQGPDENLILAD